MSMNEMIMKHIEALAEIYRQHRDALATEVAALRAVIDQETREALPGIRERLDAVAQAETDLRAAVEAAPEQFEKPRTRTLHGVRFGYMTAKARIDIPDEADTLRRIRELLPSNQSELLIAISERVDKRAVADLTAADLKRLRIRVESPVDQVVVKPTDNDVEKLIKTLLGNAMKQIQEKAA